MDPIAFLYLALVILAIIIIVKVVKFIVKIIGVIVVVIVVYLFFNGGLDVLKQYSDLETIFVNTTLENLKADLCKEKERSIKCECIVMPVYQDLTKRLTKEEIATFSVDKDAIAKQIKISLVNQQNEIRHCLIQKKGKEYMEDLEQFLKKNSDKLSK